MNKAAVITGGSRGIGAAIALELASRSDDIIILYAGNEEAARTVVSRCKEHGVRAMAIQCNVADADSVKSAVADIRREFGGVDILVNNAGITRDGLIAMMKESAFDEVIDVNLKGAFNMIRQIAPIMLRKHWGRIVNISSVSGIMGNAGQANYAASKAGLIGLTKSTAKELAAKGITCNAVAPGFVQTDMTKGFSENEDLAAMIPLGRMGKPEEIAKAVAFLIEADYITGEVLRVDGGLAM